VTPPAISTTSSTGIEGDALKAALKRLGTAVLGNRAKAR
jgi:hypothetical protein